MDLDSGDLRVLMSACHLYVVRMLAGSDIQTICSADYPPDVYPNPRTHLTLCGE